MSNDINAVAIVNFTLADGTKGHYELPAQNLDEAMTETRAMFARYAAEGEAEYGDIKTMGAKWGVPTNWIGV